jgi:ketosteroid isomerase-like protein
MLEPSAEQRALAEAEFGALNSGDLSAFLALTAEDVEFTSMVAEAEGTTFGVTRAFGRGGRAFVALLRTCDGSWSTFADLATGASRISG